MSSQEVYEVALPADVSSVAEARAFVWRVVRAHHLPLPENASLLTSEIVSNSVEHADTAVVGLAVRIADGRLRVEVRDDDPAAPEVVEPAPGRIGGYGVYLIDQLAQDWGTVEVQDDGKLVWFELPLPTGSTPP